MTSTGRKGAIWGSTGLQSLTLLARPEMICYELAMRWWLLTTTTYGTWLPGNPRGSVTSVRDRREGEALSSVRKEHDRPGEEWESEMPGLTRAAQKAMCGPSVELDLRAAEAVLDQLRETAGHRRWQLEAVSIMPTHFHVVTAAPFEIDGDKLLGDYKAYASRKLNRLCGRPASDQWWTDKGSTRPLYDDAAVAAAVHYALYKQPNPLVVWSRTHGRLI